MQPQQPSGLPPQQQPLPPQSPAPVQQPGASYDFIMNPAQPKRASPFSFGGGSKGMRIAVVIGGLFLLLILLIGFKNLLAGSDGSTPSLVGVLQDQQELVHLTANGAQNVTDGNLKDFAVTAQASLGSEKSQLVTYLLNNHHKVSTKELNLKISTSTDAQLTAALSASNYDATFKQVMQAKLTSYKSELSQAYAQTKGPKGRALLNDDYNAASLLLKQLSD